MQLHFNTAPQLLKIEKNYSLSPSIIESDLNRLIFADNLLAMEKLLAIYEGKIDLIYIDPPYATNNIFRISEDKANSISSSNNDIIAYKDDITGDEFLEFMKDRLEIIKKLLSDNGSIYLHTDYKIGHYLKVIMDSIFGIKNFRGEITRIKCNPKNFNRKAYGNVKDSILFYSKTENYIWNEQKEALSQHDIENLYPKIDANGNRYTTIPLHAPGETIQGNTGKAFKNILPPKGRHWRTDPKILEQWDNDGLIEWSKNNVPRKKIFAHESKGKKRQDIWEFKDSQKPLYPTEKNHDMLDLIIKTSSNENSIIMDCFAGSGSTLLVAQKNNRKWIGIDNSSKAIDVMKKRLQENFIYHTLEADN